MAGKRNYYENMPFLSDPHEMLLYSSGELGEEWIHLVYAVEQYVRAKKAISRASDELRELIDNALSFLEDTLENKSCFNAEEVRELNEVKEALKMYSLVANESEIEGLKKRFNSIERVYVPCHHGEYDRVHELGLDAFEPIC